MRICVIGNSHCGALVTSWREHFKNKSDVTFTFFAARGARISSLKASSGCLVSNDPEIAKMFAFTSGGIERIHPNRYDRFLVYGLIRQPPATEGDDGLSLSLRDAILADRFEKSLARKVAGRLRTITDKPITVAPAPFRFTLKDEAPAIWTLGYEEEVSSFRKLFDDIGTSYWPQPLETVILGNTRATRPEFSEGSERLAFNHSTTNQRHPDRDTSHANHLFATIWIRAYLNGLS